LCYLFARNSQYEVFEFRLIRQIRITISEIRVPVLEATHRKPVRLSIRVPVDRGVARIQVSFPCTSTTLSRRPQVRVHTPIVERAIGIAVAGEKAQRKNNHYRFSLSALHGK